MTNRPPFPLAWDSTMVKSFRSCPRQFFWQYMHHYKKDSSVHLHAGKAFASGLEEMRKAYWNEGQDTETALARGLRKLLSDYGDFQRPSDSPKSAARMAGAMEYYHSAYPLGSDGADPVRLSDGSRAIEFSFALPLSQGLVHPETGEPILYTGRTDQVVEWAGSIYVEDDKTTSQLGGMWANQWDLRSQFTGYTWGARQLWAGVTGALVTGIAIRKTGYDHARVPTPRPGYLVDRWHHQVLRDIQRAIECWQSGEWDYDLDESCNAYGGCPFKDPCKANDPQPWLDAGYVVRIWDPLTREERMPDGSIAVDVPKENIPFDEALLGIGRRT